MGEWQTEKERDTLFIEYFQEFFMTSSLPTEWPFLNSLVVRVTEEMRQSLEATFTEEEIKIALTHMHLKKASKPDGMAPLFFLTYWDIISQAETDAILEALNLGVKIFQRAPSISHLLFADDSVLFYKVNLVENRNIMSILEEY